MAKGDADKSQNQIDYQGGTAQNNLNNLRSSNQSMQQNFQSLYGPAAATNVGNYNQVQGAYDQFLNGMPNQGNLYSTFLGPRYNGATQAGPASSTAAGAMQPASDHPVDQLLAKYGAKDTGPGSGITDASYWKQKYDSTKDPYYLGRLEDDLKGNGMDTGGGSAGGRGAAIDKAISGYGGFADTGGFSPQDIANIRARAVAPIRSMAQTNTDEINRQAAIRGTGYSPNTAAAIAKVARDANYAAGDTATNAEAGLAQLIQQGKLYGLGGLASTGLSDQANNTQNRGLDLSAIGQSGNQQLGGLAGKTSLYGATPGLTNTFGSQVLGAGGQGVQIGGLQNQLAGEILNAQNAKANIPGNFQSAMGNLSSIFGLGGAAMNPLSALMKFIPGLGGGGTPMGSANPGYAGSDQFGDNLPGYDTIGGYPGSLPGDLSGGSGYGPGMQNFGYGPGSNSGSSFGPESWNP